MAIRSVVGAADRDDLCRRVALPIAVDQREQQLEPAGGFDRSGRVDQAEAVSVAEKMAGGILVPPLVLAGSRRPDAWSWLGRA